MKANVGFYQKVQGLEDLALLRFRLISLALILCYKSINQHLDSTGIVYIHTFADQYLINSVFVSSYAISKQARVVVRRLISRSGSWGKPQTQFFVEIGAPKPQALPAPPKYPLIGAF